MTFIEKLDELIAGKTQAPWNVYTGDWRVLGADDYPVCGTSNVLGHEIPNAKFIAFMGTHAEKIRDALKAGEKHFEHCQHCNFNYEDEMCTCDQNTGHVFRSALKALDEATKE